MALLTCGGAFEIALSTCGGERSPYALKLLRAGLAHHKAGRLHQAGYIYQHLLRVSPESPYVLHLKGVIAHQTGDDDSAVQLLEKAIRCRPNEGCFYNSYGEVYRTLRNHHLAIDHYERAIALSPFLVEPRYNLGLTFQQSGQPEDAVARYREAIELAPDFSDAHNNLGVAFHELGRRPQAIACYKKALESNPYCPEAHTNLGVALKESGNAVDAVLHHQISLRLAPDSHQYRTAFVECMSNIPITRASESLIDDLLATFATDNVGHQDLAFAGASIITHSPAFRSLLTLISANAISISFHDLMDAGLRHLHREPFFLILLRRTIIRDPSIERLLTAARRSLLDLAVTSGLAQQLNADLLAFVYALSLQCFYNEYVYGVSENELAQVHTLSRLLVLSLENTSVQAAALVALLGSYLPLCQFEQHRALVCFSATAADTDLALLIHQHVGTTSEEQRLRNTIDSVGTIDDHVSELVRQQYEANPYPRWLDIRKPQSDSLRRTVKRLFPHLAAKTISDTPRPEVLVAGCGTGQQVIARALQFPLGDILGVDLSLASLSYAKRKTMELGLSNVEFKQGDILKLGALNRRFDFIECIGVLHHLADPVKGWQVLVSLLKPGGFMRVGLYSELARKHIVAAQDYLAQRGYASTADGIRRARQELLAMPDTAELAAVTKITDFYTLSEARDLLFHVSEKRFSLLQISDIIGQLRLTFVGCEFPSPLVEEGYHADVPEDPTATSLYSWHKYEQANTASFLGLYLLWVRKEREVSTKDDDIDISKSKAERL